MPLPKAKKLLSVKLALYSLLQFVNQFLALAIASKNLSKTVSETCTKWSRFGTVSETRGLATKFASAQSFTNFQLQSTFVQLKYLKQFELNAHKFSWIP